jgi:thiopurine S-methyltransferase
LLAEIGYREVVAVDFAPRALVEARRCTPPPLAACIEWRCEDLFTTPAREPASFDLVVEHTSFCAVDPARRAEWFAVVRRVLRPGGTILGLFYVHAREGGPPFGGSEEEVLRLAREAHLVIERTEVPADSVAQRRNEELLLLARTKRKGERTNDDV